MTQLIFIHYYGFSHGFLFCRYNGKDKIVLWLSLKLKAETRYQLKWWFLTAAFTQPFFICARQHARAHSANSYSISDRGRANDMTLLSHPTSSSHIPATLQYWCNISRPANISLKLSSGGRGRGKFQIKH